MTIKEAYDYTKPFIKNYKKHKANIINDVIFLTNKDTVYLKVKSNLLKKYRTIDFKEFKEKYLNNEKYKFTIINTYKIAKTPLEQRILSIYDEYAFCLQTEMAETSKGIIDIEKFYLAKDIIEDTYIFKQKDLKIGFLYKDIRGKEFIYLGNIVSLGGIPYEKQFLEVNTNLIRNRSSLKIIEEIKKVNLVSKLRNMNITLNN